MSILSKLNSHKLLSNLILYLDTKDLWNIISLSKFIHDMIYRYHYWFKADSSFLHDNDNNYIPCLSHENGTRLDKLMKPIDFIEGLLIGSISRNDSIIAYVYPVYLLTRISISLNYINSYIGWGVFTSNTISSNKLLFPYYGEFIRSNEAKERQVIYDSDGLNYILTIKEYIKNAKRDLGEVQVLISNIDATYKGNIGRYVNHSCDPNMYIKMIRIQNDSKEAALVGIPVFVSLRVIAPGEQLTIDYGYVEVNQHDLQFGHDNNNSYQTKNDNETMLAKRKSTYENNSDQDIQKTSTTIIDTNHPSTVTTMFDDLKATSLFRKLCGCGSPQCRQILPNHKIS